MFSYIASLIRELFHHPVENHYRIHWTKEHTKRGEVYTFSVEESWYTQENHPQEFTIIIKGDIPYRRTRRGKLLPLDYRVTARLREIEKCRTECLRRVNVFNLCVTEGCFEDLLSPVLPLHCEVHMSYSRAVHTERLFGCENILSYEKETP